MWVILLVIYAVMVIGCMKTAAKKGRSQPLAAFMGLVFGIFAVLVYWALPVKKERMPRKNDPVPDQSDWDWAEAQLQAEEAQGHQ